MAKQQKAEDVSDMFWGGFSTLMVVGVVMFAIYLKSEFFISIWRILRLFEIHIWKSIFFMFDGNVFEHAHSQLNKTPPQRINGNWVLAFERHVNTYTRFFYSFVLITFGSMMLMNYRKVTKKMTIDSMINSYRHEYEAIAVLAEDDPTKHSRIFDFEYRFKLKGDDDYHNRHAQGMSPQMILEACPPPLATNKELVVHMKADRKGIQSPSRPITIFNFEDNTYDFSSSDARQYFERQLTKIPTDQPCYSDPENVPRLFNEHGELIDLVWNKKKKIIVGGFSTFGLINNGRDYLGSADNIRLLFDGDEREVFDFIANRFGNPDHSLAEITLKLTKQHAYTRTYLMSFLDIVRANERIGSAEFYLLARKDRGLYFALYSASEDTPFYEALGVAAHRDMELQAGQKLIQPFVKTAVETIEEDAKRIANFRKTNKTTLDFVMSNQAKFKKMKLFEESDPDYGSLLDFDEFKTDTEEKSD